MKNLKLVIVVLIILTSTKVFSQVALYKLINVNTNDESVENYVVVNADYPMNYSLVYLKSRCNGGTKWAMFVSDKELIHHYKIFSIRNKKRAALFAKFKEIRHNRNFEELTVNNRKDVIVTIDTDIKTWNTIIKFTNTTNNTFMELTYKMM